jgi:FixJ family two-component response regulator
MLSYKVSLLGSGDPSILSFQQVGVLVADDVAARIGLIDDDGSVRRAVARLLRTYGYSCVSYQSAEAALADPTFLQMNCIIVDIHHGGINGFELCDRLDALGVHIPHFFITAHVEYDLADYAGKLGSNLLLTKPFEEDQLIATIESTMKSIG